MIAERWERVGALFSEIVTLEGEERASRLRQLTTADPELGAEVESLLTSDSQADEILAPLDRLASNLALSPVPPTPDADEGPADPYGFVGETIHQYAIEAALGGGGMGVVYRAEDLRLRRTVALKFLPPGKDLDPRFRERFLHEAQAAAALDHPNVCSVYEIGETDQGQLFIAMAFYEGRTLRRRLEEGPVPIREAVQIAIQVARGLAAAHAAGVHHRDIKPANLLLTADGTVKILDFGLATRLDSTPDTAPAMGTVAYMSPEQVRGESAAAPADLWGLGVLLHELIAGRRPFRGANKAELFDAILHTEPAPLREQRPEAPPGLEALTAQLLAKDPAVRPEGAESVLDALFVEAALIEPRTAGLRTLLKEVLRERPWHAAAAALVLVVLIGSGVVAARALGRGAGETLIGSGSLNAASELVLADFESPADPELGEAVTLALRIHLGESPVLELVPEDRISELQRLMERAPEDRLDRAAARELAIRGAHEAVLSGEVRRVGGGYLLAAELVASESGEMLASFMATAVDSTELIPALAELSRDVRERVGEPLASLRSSPSLAQVTTGSLDALRHYTRGWRLADQQAAGAEAVPHLEAAVAADSGFAMALRKLAFLGDRGRRAELLERAYRHRDRLTRNEWEHVVTAHHWQHGRPDSLVAIYRRSIQLDPDPGRSGRYTNLSHYLWMMGRFAEAESLLEGFQALRRERGMPLGDVQFPNLILVQYLQGKDEELLADLERWRSDHPQSRWRDIVLTEIAEADGRTVEADSLDALLAERYGEAGRAATSSQRRRGYASATRGQLEAAVRSLESVRRRFLEEGDQTGALEAAVELARFRAMAGDTAAAIAHLRTALDASGREPLTLRSGPDDHAGGHLGGLYVELARFHAEHGRVEEATELLEEFGATIDSGLVAYLAMPLLAEASVAIADGRPAEALDLIDERPPFGEVERALVPILKGRALEAMGRTGPAIAAYEQYLAVRSLGKLHLNALYLAEILEHLAKLYEKQGEPEHAAAYHTRFSELWKDADPELQPRVQAARERLRRILEASGAPGPPGR